MNVFLADKASTCLSGLPKSVFSYIYTCFKLGHRSSHHDNHQTISISIQISLSFGVSCNELNDGGFIQKLLAIQLQDRDYLGHLCQILGVSNQIVTYYGWITCLFLVFHRWFRSKFDFLTDRGSSIFLPIFARFNSLCRI